MLDIYPDRITYFDKAYPVKSFVLLMASDAKDEVVLHNSNIYSDCKVVFFEPDQSIQNIVKKRISENTDIFFLHHKYKKPFDLDELIIDPSQRFISMGDRKTTPGSLESTKHFLDMVYQTDPEEFIQKINNFFEKFEGHSNIEYIDTEYHTKAIVNMNANCLWTEISSFLRPGEKGMIPSGELVLSHEDFTHESVKKLDMNGEITLHGVVILQAYNFNSTISKQQEILFNRLVALKDFPVIATINDGKISKLKGCCGGSETPLAALEEMFDMDERYRTVFELGIGLDSHLKLITGNCNMNETYGGNNMCVHFGFGSIFSGNDFHLDVICPSTEIRVENTKLLTGHNNISMKRVRSSQCPCE